MKNDNQLNKIEDNNFEVDLQFEALSKQYPLFHVVSKLELNKQYNDKIRLLKGKLAEVKNQDNVTLEWLNTICSHLSKSGFKFETVSSKQDLINLINNKIQKLQAEKTERLSYAKNIAQKYNSEFIKKLYRECYKECRIRDMKEGNFLEQTGERAYKMLLLFGDFNESKGNNSKLFSNLNKFIKNHGGGLQKPIHDVFTPNFLSEVTHADFDLDGWRALIQKVGFRGIKALESGMRIQEIMDGVPFDNIELSEVLSKLYYKRHKDNPILSGLCAYYKVPEQVFDKILDLNIVLKKQDELPNINISGEEVGSQGYYFMRLPADDYRGFILGYITNCCQSVGNAAEECALSGMTYNNNGFYILLKATSKNFDMNKINWKNLEETSKILGCGYLWRSTNGNLVFDSWENLRAEDNVRIIEFLRKFAKKAINKDATISRVTIGLGGNTPQCEFVETLYTENILEGVSGYDALKQGIIFESTRLKALVYELGKYIKPYNLPTGQFTCITQAKSFLDSIMGNVEEAHRVLESYKGKAATFQLLTSCYGFRELNDITILNIANYTECNIEIDYNINEALKVGVKFSTILDIASEKRSKLISSFALTTYKTGKIDINDLTDLSIDKIDLLLSHYAIEAYKKGFIIVKELKHLRAEEIAALVSYHALETYKIGIKCESLVGLNASKIKALTSYEAISAYRSGEVKIEDIKDVDADIIPYLISNWAIAIYKRGKLKVKELLGLDIERVSLIITACYYSGETDINWLKNVDIEKLKHLTSVFRYYPQAFRDFKGADTDKIALLGSFQAIMLYNAGITTANELQNLSTEQIKLFTSNEVMPLYNTGIVKLNDLINATNVRQTKQIFLQEIAVRLCNEQIDINNITDIMLEILISQNAVQAYKTKAIKISDLLGLEIERIKLLTSQNALDVYQSGASTFKGLNDIDLKKLEHLFSCSWIYKACDIKLSDLKNLEHDKIDFLINSFVVQSKIIKFCNLNTSQGLYELKYSYLQQLALLVYNDKLDVGDIEQEKLDLFIVILSTAAHNDAREATNYPKINELKDLNIEKIQLLTSYQANQLYKKGIVNIKDIKALETEKIKLLISWEAYQVYETGAVQIYDLINLTVEKIQLLVSRSLYTLYYHKVIKIADLDIMADLQQLRVNILQQVSIKLCDENIVGFYDIGQEKLNLLISEAAIECYKREAAKVSDLISLEVEKIEFLISWSFLEVYKSGAVKVCDLIGLDSNIIDILTSYEAQAAYRSGKVKAKDLVGLVPEKINFLISYEAIAAYKTGMISLHDLRDMEIEIIKHIIAYVRCTSSEINFNIADISLLNRDVIPYFLSWVGQLAFKNSKAKITNLIDLEPGRLKLLLSMEAARVYYKTATKLTDLKDINEEKLNLLFCDSAMQGYEMQVIHPLNLKELTISKIRLLVSAKAIKAYTSRTVTFGDLKNLEADRIELLISWFCNLDKRYGIKMVDLNINGDNMQVKLSFLQLIALKLCHENIRLKKSLDEEKLDLLISLESRRAYSSNTVKVSDLMDLEKPKITALISDNAVDIYESGEVRISDIKNLDIEEINSIIYNRAKIKDIAPIEDIKEAEGVSIIKARISSVLRLILPFSQMWRMPEYRGYSALFNDNNIIVRIFYYTLEENNSLGVTGEFLQSLAKLLKEFTESKVLTSTEQQGIIGIGV